MNEKKEYPKGISYKINEHGKYFIKAKEWNGKIFYNVRIPQTYADGTKCEFERQLRFINCQPPQNGDLIKIISGFESNYINSKDRYNCITCICVTEYEKLENIEEAYAQFNERIADTNDIEITDEDLPF